MKIAIITSPFGLLPPTGIGAVEKLWFNIGCEIAAMGNLITFYCKQQECGGFVDQNVKIKSFPGYRRTGSLKRDLFLDFIYSIKVLINLDYCDVIVMNTFFTPLMCLWFKHKFKVAVYNVARYPKGQFKYYRGVNRLSCVSRAVAKAVAEQAPGMASFIKVINNPVDTIAFRSRPQRISDRECVIGYSGRVNQEKGLDLLVKAYALLRAKNYRLRLRVVGPRTVALGGGGDGYIAKLESLASDFPIDWVDPVSDATQLANELCKCDIYCYPSIAERGETFGVAPLEAMAVGRPTIVSALDCFQDFIEDGVTGVVFDHRSSEPERDLADKIQWLIENPEVAYKIAKMGSQVVHDRFNTSRIAREYLADFQELLSLYDKTVQV